MGDGVDTEPGTAGSAVYVFDAAMQMQKQYQERLNEIAKNAGRSGQPAA